MEDSPANKFSIQLDEQNYIRIYLDRNIIKKVQSEYIKLLYVYCITD